jgi:signal transduction histidine kinase
MIAPLHEFMAQHRDELLRQVVSDLIAEADADIASNVAGVIDEIIRALQHDAGMPVDSPLPGKSEIAEDLGSRRQARGYAISRIAKDIGAISNRVGELGHRHGLQFEARQYQVFNQCIDTATASALDEYSKQEREQREEGELERTAVVAHELRNTLAGARMAFTVLRRGEIGLYSKTGNVLDRSLRQLESLIGEMVFAVRLRAGSRLELRPIPLEELLGQVLDAAVPERDITLRSDIAGRLMVNGDETLLVSAIVNLVQNAFKFTHARGTISVRARAEGAAVVVEVEDECGGLPPGKPEELFAPFVSKGVERRGLGLGLTITRQAVEAHGGEISVKDLPGKGCVFRVVLPAAVNASTR